MAGPYRCRSLARWRVPLLRLLRLQVVARELPQDPANQLLLGLYFFLAGMLVRSHPHMWLLPATSCAMAVLSALVHVASKLLTSSYA